MAGVGHYYTTLPRNYKATRSHGIHYSYRVIAAAAVNSSSRSSRSSKKPDNGGTTAPARHALDFVAATVLSRSCVCSAHLQEKMQTRYYSSIPRPYPDPRLLLYECSE